MVAIQVLPLEPDIWPDPDERRDDQPSRRVRQAQWRPLPDRSAQFRRRRLGVLVGAAAALVALAVLVDVLAGSAGSRPAPEIGTDRLGPITEDVYVVQPGDTLWSIAERVAPDQDPRPVVDELREINGGVELDVGDRLRVGEL